MAATYWLFSFSDYYDPANIQFGALRVFNDDVVQPGTGFPTHPHYEFFFEVFDNRRIFVYITNGVLSLNGKVLKAKTQARIDEESMLVIKSIEDADFILIDVPSCKGWGYNKEILKGSKA